tara:strand:- start:9399 stop:10142 length:744 start_codon:yes stop_codon:yes gene_type:complete
MRIGIALILAGLFALVAFILNWLTIDGSKSAAIFGTIAYGLGGWQAALLVLVFFISASLFSKDTISTEDHRSIKFRRTGAQVWANGFWFALWLMIWFITKEYLFLTAAVASIAAANADTWATELGNKAEGKTFLITTLERVKSGTDGGISISGSLAALAGSSLIAILFWITFANSTTLSLVLIIVAGVVGCFFDSFLGARYQGYIFSKNSETNVSARPIVLDNNFVNWIAVGSSSIIVLLITLIFEV